MESTPTPSASDPRAVARDIFSATIGSICCCYVGQPFDTTKVRPPQQFEIRGARLPLLAIVALHH
jgi:hypothetical protein